MKIIQYNHIDMPFCRIIGNIFNCHNLMFLHTLQKRVYSELIPGKDQHTEFHEQFYNVCKNQSEFMLTYKNLIKYIGFDFLGLEKFLYQKIPTFRIQLPNNKAVGGISHKDSDYNHPLNEINFLVPLTSMIGSSALFLESEPGLRDFKLISLSPGEILMFNGANLEHGNISNTSGWTRVSFDFRILPQFSNIDINSKTIAHGLRFMEGEYYLSSQAL